MERTRVGLFPLVIPALVIVPIAGLALLLLAVRWFDADAQSALRHRAIDAAAAAGRQLDASVQRQAAVTRALGTSPMVWLWVKFQGEHLSPSNRSHAQWALDEVANYSAVLPGTTVYLASERTRTVYLGGAAVAALSRNDPGVAWYPAALGTEGVLVSDDPRALRTSMRVMDGQTLLGAISCVGDLPALAEDAFSAAAEGPGLSFALADGEGSVVVSRGEAAAASPTVFDVFSPPARGGVRAAMDAAVRPGAVNVAVFPAHGRLLLTAVTRTNAPGWYLFVFSNLPRVSAARIVVLACVAAAGCALLVAALLLIGLAQAREIDTRVGRLEREREEAAGIVREVGAAALRLRSSADALRGRAAILASEASGGRAAGAEAARLLGMAEERSAEVRAGIAARASLLDELAASARDAAGKSRTARSAAETAGLNAAAAEVELNRVITTGGAVTLSVENAMKGADALLEAAERARLIALNAALEASRLGGLGARAADDMRKVAEEAAVQARALAASLAEARSNMRTVSRAAQDAGNTVHQAGAHTTESARGLAASWQGLDGILSQLEAARAGAAHVREEAEVSDRGRSAVDGVARIMTRIEAVCAEMASLAAAVAAESAQASRRSSPPGSSSAYDKAIS